MSLVPFTFNRVALKVMTVDSKDWCRAKEVCKALEYKKDTAHVVKSHCSRANVAHKYELSGLFTVDGPVNWPIDSQRYNLYVNEEGLY